MKFPKEKMLGNGDKGKQANEWVRTTETDRRWQAGSLSLEGV